jgi:hypothetical protein
MKRATKVTGFHSFTYYTLLNTGKVNMTWSCLYQHQLATATTLQHHQIMTQAETGFSFHIQAKRRFHLYWQLNILFLNSGKDTRICDFPWFQSDAIENNVLQVYCTPSLGVCCPVFWDSGGISHCTSNLWRWGQHMGLKCRATNTSDRAQYPIRTEFLNGYNEHLELT